jgi:hypothetical protein
MSAIVAALVGCAEARDVIALPWAVQSGKPDATSLRKINSQLRIEIERQRARDAGREGPALQTDVRLDEKGRARVDVRARITPVLEAKIRALGSEIFSSSAQYDSLIAWVPVGKLEELARDPAVMAIEPAAEARTVK